MKKNWEKFTFKLFFLFFAILPPIVSFADTTDDECTPAGGKICNPINANTVEEFIKVLLEGALKIGIPLIALAIIYCGFLFVEARGNAEKLSKAKSALLYTLVGAAILLGAWAIAKLIANTVLVL